MFLALKLARRGLGRTSPNPAVGAVIVKNGLVVGKGYHRAAGFPHAEVEAIRSAGSEALGSNLFVTLEPCNHHGRTPPCTKAILEAGIRRVYYGTDDPNPGVTGGGARLLQEAGVHVVGHVLESRCRRINEVYLTNITQKRPFVFLKLAMSLDGRIATKIGASKWITSEASRRKVHRLRDRVSAIMVGIGTVIADNPSLTTRLPGSRGHDPIRVIVDSSLRTPPESLVLNSDSASGCIIASTKNPPLDRKLELEKRGAKVLSTKGGKQVDLPDLLSRLYAIGITSVLVEGGAGLAWGALEAGIVDRCLFFYAPIIIGGAAAPSGIEGIGISRLDEAPRLVDMKAFRIGPDILLDGIVAYPANRDQTQQTK